MQSHLSFFAWNCDSSSQSIIQNKLSFSSNLSKQHGHSYSVWYLYTASHGLFYKTIYVIKLKNTFRLGYTAWQQVLTRNFVPVFLQKAVIVVSSYATCYLLCWHSCQNRGTGGSAVFSPVLRSILSPLIFTHSWTLVRTVFTVSCKSIFSVFLWPVAAWNNCTTSLNKISFLPLIIPVQQEKGKKQ